MTRAETVLPAPEKYLLDLLDPQDYGTAIAGTTVAFARRGGGPMGTGFSTGPIWETATNFGVAINRRNGLSHAEAVSAAATLKVRNSSRWQIPVRGDVSNVPAAGLWPLRYRMETIVWRVTTPLIAAAPLAFVCVYDAVGRNLNDPAGTPAGVQLVSDSTINAGRWTVQTRLVAAGAVATVVDTGVTPDNAGPQVIELRYDHTTAPVLSFLINGVEFGRLVGLANLPTPNGNLQVTGLVQGLSAAGGVGQTDAQRQTRFRIEQLTGFPE